MPSILIENGRKVILFTSSDMAAIYHLRRRKAKFIRSAGGNTQLWYDKKYGYVHVSPRNISRPGEWGKYGSTITLLER